jgi:hypothetical protein
VVLTQIADIDEATALSVLSEIGFEMSRWPIVKHFTSWLGLCPHHRVSGGKVLKLADHTLCQAGGDSPPAGSRMLAPQSECLRGFLLTDESPAGCPQSHHRYRA